MKQRPRLSVRAVVVAGGRILLARYRDGRGDWYVCPGGGVRHGETVEEAFHREMAEEVGLRCAFGDLICVREIIADRHEQCHLPAGFHQVELFVRAELLEEGEPHAAVPDTGQVGLEWLPLAELGGIEFFPRGMVAEFQAQRWDRLYYGDRR